MDKPAFNTGMTTPPPFFRKTVSPVAPAEPASEPTPAPVATQDVASPAQASQSGGLSPDEFHALIEMVSATAEQVAGMPAALETLSTQVDERFQDLKNLGDLKGLTKKVDSLGVELRELSAAVQHLHNGVALLCNIWRPMGVPYSSLADVPEPASYLDDVAAE